MGPRSEKFTFSSVLNFRRVTHLWLCLLETQVTPVGLVLADKMLKQFYLIYL